VEKKKSRAWVIAFFVVLVILGIVILPFFFLIAPRDIVTGDVAVISVRGVITEDGDSSFGQESAAASDIVGFIEDADENPLIQAIVIDINSPGGSAVASDEIGQALKKANKPTIAIIHEIGTSGAYWVASATDVIIANRMSITGSIGVIASYLEFSELMDEYGVSYQRFVAGSRKDIGTPFKEPTVEERALMQSKLDVIHDFFIEEIAQNRGLSTTQVKFLATGEFFLGQEALRHNLVDMLGGKKELETTLAQFGIEDPDYYHYMRELSFFDLLMGVTGEHFFFMGQGIGHAITKQTTPFIQT
jgi:protease IV